MTIFVYDDVTGEVMSKEQLAKLRAGRSPAKQTASLPSVVERGRWKWDRKNQELVSIDEFYRRYPDYSIGLQIVKDVEPYKSVVSGEVIGGRKQHRDHLKGRGLVEIGNEKVERKPLEAPPGLGEDIRRALEQTGWDGRIR
jgi:hypothetical protein